MTSIPDTDSLPGKRVLITGASRGIGYEIAKDLAASGALLWLTGKSESILQIPSRLGTSVVARRMNVADAQSVAEVFAEIHRDWEGLDAVIHAAAELGEAGPFWEIDFSEFESILKVNTLGSFNVAREFVRLWLATAASGHSGQRGKIVLFAGGGAAYGYPRFLPYGVSKAAAVRMCETMSMELDAARLPIDINIIAPGANDTRMLAAVRAAGGEVRTVVPFSKPIALSRWLLSSAADGASGRFIHVNDSYKGIPATGLREDTWKLRRVDL
jgi:NAD(P)-dependent dehydrogenase (short-subunit alcohol dehydrogenase family)